MRASVIDPQAAHVWVAIGGAERLLLPGAIVAGAFALGWWAFNRAAPRIAELAVIDADAPHPWDLAGPEAMLVAAAIVVLALVLGAYVFNRQAPRIAEHL